MDYDSESEDSPRIILDLAGDFTWANLSPETRPFTFKLRDLDRAAEERTTGRTIALNEIGAILASRPVPSPASVSRARQLMGEGLEGVWTATKFLPPSDPATNAQLPPSEVFRLRQANSSNPFNLTRFCIRRRYVPAVSDLKTMCIFTDGACLNNGSDVTQPKAGAAFVFKDGTDGQVSFALENQGPDGQFHPHTNSRAELRAVIAALRFRVWWGEGWQRIVIVTDSEYVANHATSWIRNWATRGWRLASGKPVANKDLWQELSTIMGSFAESGCEISFWAVPRRMNDVADRAAKAAAGSGGGNDMYADINGVLV